MSDVESTNDEEALRAKHRKEKKELLAKIQSMKKAATAKDKKKKVLEDIAKLEADLSQRHLNELETFKSLTITEPVNEIEDEVKPTPSSSRVKINNSGIYCKVIFKCLAPECLIVLFSAS